MATHMNLCSLPFTDSVGFSHNGHMTVLLVLAHLVLLGLYCSSLFLGHCSLLYLKVLILHVCQLSAQMLSL